MRTSRFDTPKKVSDFENADHARRSFVFHALRRKELVELKLLMTTEALGEAQHPMFTKDETARKLVDIALTETSRSCTLARKAYVRLSEEDTPVFKAEPPVKGYDPDPDDDDVPF